MITDAEGLLAARFEATRDRYDDADWSDVLSRRAPRHSSRQRVWLITAVLVAVAVPTAVAFGGHLRDLFFHRPAPPIIKRAFAQQNEMARLMHNWQKAHGERFPAMPQVDPAKAHGVIAAKTPDGLLLLWAAPTNDRRECWFIDFAADQLRHKRATGGGSCDPNSPPPSKIQWGFGWSAAHPTLKVLSGRLYVDAAAVIVDFPNHHSATVPVIDRYFLAAYPRATQTPSKLTAINTHGQKVTTLTTHR